MMMLFLLLSTYPWPIRPFDTAHGVSATLGDARATYNDQGEIIEYRFHRGIDIPASAGTDVFSIISGTARWDRSRGTKAHVRVEDHWYVHLSNRIRDGAPVIGIVDTVGTSNHPTRIGDVASDHLHFGIGDPPGPGTDPIGPFTNPLSNGGPERYSDTQNPRVYSLDFWRSGSEGNNPVEVKLPLWGKIDIRAKCRDIKNSGGVLTTTGIYRVKWFVVSRGVMPRIWYIPVEEIRFDQVQPPNNGAPVLLIYDRHHYTDESPFYYWVTNCIVDNEVEDRYWNTKLRFGEAWDGDDARINREAVLPDGEYRVWVLAYDIKGNGGDTLHRRGAEDEDVVLDNFVPYLDSVVVIAHRKDGDEVIYRGWWRWDGRSLSFCSASPGSVYRDDRLEVILVFSETMQKRNGCFCRIKGATTYEVNGSFSGKVRYKRDRWAGSFDVPDDHLLNGLDTLVVQGFDVVKHRLDTLVTTIGFRDNTGAWQNYEPGEDKHHRIYFAIAPIIKAFEPPEGKDDVEIEDKIVIKFSHPMDTVSVRKALSISPCVTGRKYEWDSDLKTLTIRINEDQGYFEFQGINRGLS